MRSSLGQYLVSRAGPQRHAAAARAAWLTALIILAALPSPAVASKPTDGSSNDPSISGDGHYLAFTSSASNIDPGDPDTNGASDVFALHRKTGVIWRVSVDSTGLQANGASSNPSISDDGRYITFGSGASNLVPGDTNRKRDVFVHDIETGETLRASVKSTGGELSRCLDNGSGGCSYPEGSGDPGWSPAISGDGRYIAFVSRSDWVMGDPTGGGPDTNGASDIYIFDRTTGTTVGRPSVSSSGQQGASGSWSPTISDDGRYVAFSSPSSQLVSNDTNGVSDIFLRDRVPKPRG